MSLRENSLGRSGVEIVVDGGDGAVGSVIVSKNGKSAKIGYISVKQGYRGRGIGSNLLETAENWARREGVENIEAQLIPTPGSENSVVDSLKNRGYQIDVNTGVAKKNLESS